MAIGSEGITGEANGDSAVVSDPGIVTAGGILPLLALFPSL